MAATETVTYTMIVENTGSVTAYDANFFLCLPFFEDDLAVEQPLLQNVSFVIDDSINVYDDSGNESTPGAFFASRQTKRSSGSVATPIACLQGTLCRSLAPP